jgi:hypothetical protein
LAIAFHLISVEENWDPRLSEYASDLMEEAFMIILSVSCASTALTCSSIDQIILVEVFPMRHLSMVWVSSVISDTAVPFSGSAETCYPLSLIALCSLVISKLFIGWGSVRRTFCGAFLSFPNSGICLN